MIARARCAKSIKKFAVKPLTIEIKYDIINTSKGNELTGRQGNSQARKLPSSIFNLSIGAGVYAD